MYGHGIFAINELRQKGSVVCVAFWIQLGTENRRNT